MPYVNKRQHGSRSGWDKASSLGVLLLLVLAGGCGGGTTTAAPPQTATPAAPQSYFAPVMAGTTNLSTPLFAPLNYTFDDAGGAFTQSLFQVTDQQMGNQLLTAGTIGPSSRGLLDLGISVIYNSQSSFAVTTPPFSMPPSFALELAGQAGALVQLGGQPVAPLVPSTQCPNIGATKTFQFLTIPGSLIQTSAAPQAYTWNPLTDTAYGSVDVSTTGSTVNFANIKQFTLGGGSPSIASPMGSVPGACGLSSYGNTISVPGQISVSDPNSGGQTISVPVQAIANIGPSGLLVEDNGTGAGVTKSAYENVLGAGTGAVGLPRPTSAVASSALSGMQYLGFIYGAGTFTRAGIATGWSSNLASFGSSGVSSSCSSSFSASTTTTIYGGTLTNNDPSTSPDGSGLCNFAIDLGVENPKNDGSYGIFPAAKVYIGATYPANTTKIAESFSAVAIVGQLQGQLAIFALGVDSTQPWSIYLLRSN